MKMKMMSELNVEVLKGEAGFFVLLVLLFVACGYGVWREYRWARVCNDEYDEGFDAGYDTAWAWMQEQRKVVDEKNAGCDGCVDLDTYSAAGSVGAEGFEAAHRGGDH